MFANMLDHPNIKIMLNTDYRDVKDALPYRELIYTGPVDEFFDFSLGNCRTAAWNSSTRP